MRISDWSSDVCSSDLDPNVLLCAIAFETIHGGPNSIFSALGDILRYRERIAAWPRIIKRYAVIPMQIGVPCHRQAVRNSLDLTANQPAFIRMNAKARGFLLSDQILRHYKVGRRCSSAFWDMQILWAAHCLLADAMKILIKHIVPAAHPMKDRKSKRLKSST